MDNRVRMPYRFSESFDGIPTTGDRIHLSYRGVAIKSGSRTTQSEEGGCDRAKTRDELRIVAKLLNCERINTITDEWSGR
jgi:hypothetical protein